MVEMTPGNRLVLLGVEIHNGMSEEATAARRALIMATLEKGRACGFQFQKPKFLAPPRPKAPSMPRAPHESRVRRTIARTPEELEAIRKKRIAADCARKKAYREQVRLGLAPRLPRRRKPSVSKVKWLIQPESWITYKSRGGEVRIGKVLRAVPAFEDPCIPPGSDLRGNGTPGPVRGPRYLIALPGIDAVATPPVLLPMATEVEKGLLHVHEGLPVLPRLHQPIPKGTPVSWMAQGGGKEVHRSGLVEAYVPAGVPLTSVFPSYTFSPRDGVSETSIRDRYVVACDRVRNDKSRGHWSVPAAYVLERAYTETLSKVG